MICVSKDTVIGATILLRLQWFTLICQDPSGVCEGLGEVIERLRTANASFSSLMVMDISEILHERWPFV